MPIPIPPEIQAPITQAVAWLWDKYGQPVAEKAARRVVDETKWKFGIEKYYTSLFERVGFVRILGRMESEPLENVFTHVNVLDKLTAEQRYDIAKLVAEFNPRDFEWLERVRRVAGDEAVAEFPKLFILGKPGAGKTTFLKHTALRAVKHEIKKVPLFVTLKELSDSGMGIVEFMTHQLSVHRFPEPEVFLARLLENGDALVLFDGLDEVNLEDDRRSKTIQQINDFVYRYSDCSTLMTCRVAATDYSFTQFEYVEMADFDTKQMATYIDLWFVGNEVKRENFKKVLLKDDNYRPVRELAQVPLLLALLCLVYEERNEIPPERHEIYEEAMRALLSKWDASRNISRDVVYQQLSLGRKQKMLATIAAQTFEQGDYFLKKKDVVRMIGDYLQGVPGLEEPDAELVLQSLEAQHGIFVERARGIHSFSHLTLQEYFTARHIVDNESRGAVRRFMAYVGDYRWREVFLLVAGMLDDATEFGEMYLLAANNFLQDDKTVLRLLDWASEKEKKIKAGYKPAASRAYLVNRVLALDYSDLMEVVKSEDMADLVDSELGMSFTFSKDLAQLLDSNLAQEIHIDLEILIQNIRLDIAHNRETDLGETPELDELLESHQCILDISRRRNLTIMQEMLGDISLATQESTLEAKKIFSDKLKMISREFWQFWYPDQLLTFNNDEVTAWRSLPEFHLVNLINFLEQIILLVRCLQVAYVPDRQALEDKILLPPDMW